MQSCPLHILSGDEPLLKNERSAALIRQVRADLPNALVRVFTAADLKNADSWSQLENELTDVGLFSMLIPATPEEAKQFSSDRIIRLYLDGLDETAFKVLLFLLRIVLTPRDRFNFFVIVDLPRVKYAYLKAPGKKLPNTAGTPEFFRKLEKDRRKAETKCAELLGYLISLKAGGENFYPPEGQELVGWVSKRARAYRLTLTGEAAVFIAMSCEGNLMSIDQTLQALTLLNTQGQISGDDVQRCMTQDSRYTGFELTDAIFQAQAERALNILNSLVSGSADRVYMVGFLIGRLEAALNTVRDARDLRIRSTSADNTPFFAAHKVATQTSKQAIVNAACNMPQDMFDYMVKELARASLLYSRFQMDEAVMALQNICAVVRNPAVAELKPLC